ncbi:glycosyltransferase [Listeria aquatica]|uniref:glycosyltransferase n=1 Tax=Listeria aquatica TaxID=1494960 RepID=UPI003F707DE7
MFVWNEFTNDARVLRECTALQEAGYSVYLIALKSKHKQPAIEKREEGFQIHRVDDRILPFRTEWLYLIALCIAYMAPLVGLVCAFLLLLFSKTKVRFLIRKLILISKMIILGMKAKTDIYHANDLNTLFQGIICAKCKHKKLVFDSHEVNTSRSGYDSRIYQIAEKVFIRFPDCVIHENYTRAKYIRRIYGFTPEVIYNYPFFQEGIEKIDLHKKLNIPKNEPILLYQGGLQVGRGLEKLLKAVPLIRYGTVVFIGDGKLKKGLIDEAERAGLANRVKFLDKVPVQELPLYTRSAYLGFQLLNNTCFNHFSAASNKLFEYMMAGVPVIACSFPEMKKIVKQERVGILVDSADPVSIANSVNELVENQELWREMKENALEARKIYNWDKEKIKFLAIYQKLSKDEKNDA